MTPDLFKLYVTVFAATDPFGPADFVPVFHRWIRDRVLPDHLAIDVADYAHVAEGPGTLLVTSEANVHMSRVGGRLALTYSRKRPVAGTQTLEQTARAVLAAARTAADLMEREPALAGRLRFDAGEVRVGFNDRLLAPNTAEAYAAVEPDLRAAAVERFGPTTVISRVENDPAERLEIRLTVRAA